MEEDTTIDCNSKKRVRHDSDELDLLTRVLKRVQTNTCTDVKQFQSKRVDPKNEPESLETGDFENKSAGSTEGKMGLLQTPNINIPEDFLDILEDAETTMPAIQELESVIRSFEEEILQSSPSAHPNCIVGVTSDAGESQPELGYLLEASDDELGLPPTVSTWSDQAHEELTHMQPGTHVENEGLKNVGECENVLASYESLGFGLSEGTVDMQSTNGEFAGIADGLFEYSESADFSDFAWHLESLPAL